MHNKSTINRTSEVRSQRAVVRRLFAFDSAFRFYRKHITEDRRTTRFQRCRATVKAGITSEIGAYSEFQLISTNLFGIHSQSVDGFCLRMTDCL